MKRLFYRIFASTLAMLGSDVLPALATPDDVSKRPPNFVLVSIDTLRADHVGAYGYPRPTTPGLDQLAAEGVVFTNAMAQSPWTLPSHASLLTGLYTRDHALRDDHHQLAPDIPALTQILSRAGYRIGAVVNSHYLLPHTGLLRVCEFFRYFPPQDGDGGRVLSAAEQVAEAIAFLDTEDPRPFFLFLHTYDIHSDYAPGPAYREQFVRPYEGSIEGTTLMLGGVPRGLIEVAAVDAAHLIDLYDGALRQLDDHLARLFAHLDAAGLRDSTWVVVTSDHGEEFLDHGGVLHGFTLYDEMLRVPLIVRGPGVPSGARVDRLTPLVDVAPTIIALAGRTPPRPLPGRDLRSGWSDDDGGSDDRAAFAELDRRKLAPKLGARLGSVRTGPLKLVLDRETNEVRLFDRASDPGERRDVSRQRPAEARRLEALLRDHLVDASMKRGEVPLDADELELLRRLGYVE